MKKNVLIAKICQHFAGLVSSYQNSNFGEYEDFYSLNEALNIANKFPNEVEREDVEGWKNPHLDFIWEEWDE